MSDVSRRPESKTISRAPAKRRREAEFRLGTPTRAAADKAEDSPNTSKKPVDRKCQRAETDDNGHHEIGYEICFVVELARFKHVRQRPPMRWNPVRQSSRISHAFGANQDFSRKKYDSQQGDPAANNTEGAKQQISATPLNSVRLYEAERRAKRPQPSVTPPYGVDSK